MFHYLGMENARDYTIVAFFMLGLVRKFYSPFGPKFGSTKNPNYRT